MGWPGSEMSEFLRAPGSQSGVSVATYSGRLAVARSFIRQRQLQCSSAKLLSWWCLPWVWGTFTLVYLGLRTGWGMWLATRQKSDFQLRGKPNCFVQNSNLGTICWNWLCRKFEVRELVPPPTPVYNLSSKWYEPSRACNWKTYQSSQNVMPQLFLTKTDNDFVNSKQSIQISKAPSIKQGNWLVVFQT